MTGWTFRFAGVSGQRIEGRFARRSPPSTSSLWHACLALCMFSLTAALFLGYRGFHAVLKPIALCVAVVAWLWVTFSPKARRMKMISLQGGSLVVERWHAAGEVGALEVCATM